MPVLAERTSGSPSSMGLTSHNTWKYPIPSAFGIHHVVSPDPYRSPFSGTPEEIATKSAEDIRENGMTVPPSMGLATALNFQPTGGGKAAITGDFVLLGSEVNPVITALDRLAALCRQVLTEPLGLSFGGRIATAQRTAVKSTRLTHQGAQLLETLR